MSGSESELTHKTNSSEPAKVSARNVGDDSWPVATGDPIHSEVSWLRGSPQASVVTNLLFRLSEKVSSGAEVEALVDSFCQDARKLFQADGACCWRVEGECLVAVAIDGDGRDELRGLRVPLEDLTAAAEAVRSRSSLLVGDVDKTSRYSAACKVPCKSLMAVPLVIDGEAIGTVVFINHSRPDAFNQEQLEQASVLGTLLGSLMETMRVRNGIGEERRRAEVLVECAASLYSMLDGAAVRSELTRRVTDLLGAELVAMLELKGQTWTVTSIRCRPESGFASLLNQPDSICRFGEHVAPRLEAENPLLLNLSKEPLGLPMVGAGRALVVSVPIEGEPALLVTYSGPEHNFSRQEIALMRAVAGIGALSIQNSELFRRSEAQANELQQLLEIANELGSLEKIDLFLERFAVRAASFLNFKRSFIAIAGPDGSCQILHIADPMSKEPMIFDVPEKMRDFILGTGDVFWTDNATQEGVNTDLVQRFQVKQILMAPLLRSNGGTMGVLGVLDRVDGAGISQEDVRRARALASQIAVVLESRQNLSAAEEQRKRAENLIALAFDINTSLRVPELVRVLGTRGAQLLGGSSAVVALARGNTLESVFIEPEMHDSGVQRRLNAVLAGLASRMDKEHVRYGSGRDVVGESLANELKWRDVTIAQLRGMQGDLIGLLCVANRGRELNADDRNLLNALVSHASVALDNSRLFARMAQSNSQWTEIFDSITDFIVVHDQSYRVLRVNRSMAEFIGVRPAELIGVNMRALMALARDSAAGACPFCRQGADTSDEFMHPVLERTYLVSTSTVHGALDEGQQTIHVLKDITDRREAEQRYRELFDNIQEGLFFLSPEGRFVEVNDAMVRMLGYGSREELLEVDVPTQLYCTPQAHQEYLDAIKSAGMLRNYEQKLRRKDGSVIYVLENSFAVRDAQGKITQYRGVMLDITELKSFHAELQRQRDFNDKILNNTQSLIMVADTAGLVSYANRRCYEVGGYQDALVGKPLVNLVAEKERDLLKKALAWTLVGQTVDNLELPFLLAGQRLGRFSVNLSPMRDDAGQVNSIVVVMSDVTDEALLKAKLMHTEKMAAVGQLVSGVAHEVNNPLTAILGFADLLAASNDVPENVKPDLEIIIQEAQRTKQIVQNLLSFARQTPPQREPLQVNELLRRTLLLRSYDFSTTGVKIMENYQEPAPDLVADSHQLQQVFLNILNNAFDAVHENGNGGQIEISSRYDDHWAEIHFSDNGPGIKATERIFDPFYTTKQVGKGTGLGLSICYGIVHEHGGEIIAANREGGGAVFTVRLPLAPEMVLEGEHS